MKTQMQRPTLTCKRCGAKWESRINRRPIRCPRCQSPKWDQIKERK